MKRNLLVRRLLSIGLLGLLVGGFSQSGKAQLTNYDWWSTSANSNFSSASWYDGTNTNATLSSGSTVGTVSFGGNGTVTSVFDDLASLTVSGLTLGSTGGTPVYYTVTVNAGSALTVNNGSLSMSAASSTLVSAGSLVLNNATVGLSATTGTISSSGTGTVTLTGANTFSASASGQTLTVSAALSGTGGERGAHLLQHVQPPVQVVGRGPPGAALQLIPDALHRVGEIRAVRAVAHRVRHALQVADDAGGQGREVALLRGGDPGPPRVDDARGRRPRREGLQHGRVIGRESRQVGAVE